MTDPVWKKDYINHVRNEAIDKSTTETTFYPHLHTLLTRAFPSSESYEVKVIFTLNRKRLDLEITNKNERIFPPFHTHTDNKKKDLDVVKMPRTLLIENFISQ